MIWQLENLLNSALHNAVEIGGRWYPGRPLRGPLVERIRAAWLVLTDRADAVVWPAGQ